MTNYENYITSFPDFLANKVDKQPWEILNELDVFLIEEIKKLSLTEYEIDNNIAIHKSAIIEQNVILKGVIIVTENCFIGSNAYLRGPIFLGQFAKLGPGVEVKQSIVLSDTAIAHFNFIGNSFVGKNVNFEAGSICANHYNERIDKRIFVKYGNQIIDTKTNKFGALIGDNSKIGANAVLSPGTILEKDSVVKRLALIEQIN